MTSPRQILLILSLLLNFSVAKAQETGDHDHHEHEHHKNEISVGAFPVYLLNEKELTYGLHLHYTYNFPKSKAGIGLGFEKIFDDHKHNSLNIFLSYRPVENLHIGLGPGLAFEGHKINQAVFAMHLETAWEFIIHNFHVGPMLGFGIDKNDMHMGVGIHFGVGF